MALRPGDQDGVKGVAPGAVTIPSGCVVHAIECLAGASGCTMDDSAFATSRAGAITVPPGAGYEDTPNQYVGDGVKQIVFAGDLLSWEVSWTVL